MSSKYDQIILDDAVLVMANGCNLMVAEGEMTPAGAFSFDPEDVMLVIPGVPLRTLLPLAKHEKEIRGLLFDIV